MLRRILVILVLIGIVAGIFSAFIPAYNALSLQPPELDLSNLNQEQEALRDAYLIEKEALKPEQLTILESGEPLYIHPDNSLSRESPEWYKYGTIVLTQAEKEELAKYAITDTPSWVFWEEDKMTYSKYTTLLDVIFTAILIGMLFGVISEKPFGSGLIASGIILGTLTIFTHGLAACIIFILFFTTGFEFTQLVGHYSGYYWNYEPKEKGGKRA